MSGQGRGVSWPGHGRFEWGIPEERPPGRNADGTVETVYFCSHGPRLEAWLFAPHRATDTVIVMAPGLTSTKDSLLEPFAWEFVRQGAAVLLFDFRTLGGSEGMPRHWVDPFRQMQDYETAIEFAQGRFAHVVLWGSSFSGGEALMVAARNPDRVDAVIAQVPFLNPSPDLEPRGWRLARLVALAVLDLAMARLSGGRLPPVYVAAFGKPGQFVFFASAECPDRNGQDLSDADAFFRALPNPLRGGWRNVLCARMLANIERFRPMEHLGAVRCPVLVIGAERDDMMPSSYLDEAANLCTRAQVELLSCGHFGVYRPPFLEQNLGLQTDFVRRRLRVHGLAEPHDATA
ncbi:MAG: alpha/beta fold hydrolase [Deltaproteobacteria bacterium]|nr:alpha/beta fold hydrolase [Deltaproteobacteria bacterium]